MNFQKSFGKWIYMLKTSWPPMVPSFSFFFYWFTWTGLTGHNSLLSTTLMNQLWVNKKRNNISILYGPNYTFFWINLILYWLFNFSMKLSVKSYMAGFIKDGKWPQLILFCIYFLLYIYIYIYSKCVNLFSNFL